MAKLRVPDLCIDLGTARTRIGVRGQGVVVDIPTVVAMRGPEVVAIGDEAVQMSGRVPAGLDVVRPIIDTEVTDFAATERLVGSVLRVATSARRKPRVLALLPSGATEVQRRATLESLRAAGARATFL